MIVAVICIVFVSWNPYGAVLSSTVGNMAEVPTTTHLLDEPKAFEEFPQKIMEKKCPNGMVYSSEVDECVDRESEKSLPLDDVRRPSSGGKQRRSPSATIDPSKPSMEELVGIKKCREWEVYVSEVDMCVKQK